MAEHYEISVAVWTQLAYTPIQYTLHSENFTLLIPQNIAIEVHGKFNIDHSEKSDQ